MRQIKHFLTNYKKKTLYIMRYLKRYSTDADYNSDKNELQWPTVCGIDDGNHARFIEDVEELGATVTMYPDKKVYALEDTTIQSTIIVAHNLTEPCDIELSCEDSNVTINQDTFTNVISAVSTYMTYPLAPQDGVNGSKTFHITAEITSADQSIEEDAELVVNNIMPRVFPITITSGSDSKLYDGIEFSDSTYNITSGSLLSGHHIADVTISGRITNAGSVTNTISNVLIWDSSNTDVTNYYDITYVSGTLTVERRNVIITSASDTKTFDGSGLTNDGIEVTGDGFATGENATYDVTGNQTLVGRSQNQFIYYLTPGTNSGNYNITIQFGTLTVTDGTGVDEDLVEPDLVVWIEEITEPKDSGGYAIGETIAFSVNACNIYSEEQDITLSSMTGLTLGQSRFDNVHGGEWMSTTATYVVTEADGLAGSYTATVDATVGNLTKTAEITVATTE